MERWSKAILLVDMDAFFAAIEQLDYPELRGQSVVITNGWEGSTIITCSYEARSFGIKTGMKLWQAQRLCPSLIRCGSRPHRYGQISRQVMAILASFSPDIEIFSVDEAFLDVTRCQRLYGAPVQIARRIKQAIFSGVGLTCSVGVSGDKTTAKYAAKLGKPNGCSVIAPWESKNRLAPLLVSELCGIGPGVTRFLGRYGVVCCGDMARLPIGLLAKRFGNFGRRLWYMCQGGDPYPVRTSLPEAKSMGHGKVLPPGTYQQQVVLSYFQQMSERLAERLRRHGCVAQVFFVGILVPAVGWLAGRYRTPILTDDGAAIYALCRACVQDHGMGYVVRQVQVTALSVHHGVLQQDLFADDVMSNARDSKVNQAMDAVNKKFGSSAVVPAGLLATGRLTQVIAPSWQATGARDSLTLDDGC
jgi:DNA polymerase IV